MVDGLPLVEELDRHPDPDNLSGNEEPPPRSEADPTQTLLTLLWAKAIADIDGETLGESDLAHYGECLNLVCADEVIRRKFIRALAMEEAAPEMFTLLDDDLLHVQLNGADMIRRVEDSRHYLRIWIGLASGLIASGAIGLVQSAFWARIQAQVVVGSCASLLFGSFVLAISCQFLTNGYPRLKNLHAEAGNVEQFRKELVKIQDSSGSRPPSPGLDSSVKGDKVTSSAG